MRHLLFAAVAVLIAGPALADDKCIVTDPSGTPLNVRSAPGGKTILTSLPNGVTVLISDYGKDAKGNDWAHIASLNGDPKAKGGWVRKDLVSCF